MPDEGGRFPYYKPLSAYHTFTDPLKESVLNDVNVLNINTQVVGHLYIFVDFFTNPNADYRISNQINYSAFFIIFTQTYHNEKKKIEVMFVTKEYNFT